MAHVLVIDDDVQIRSLLHQVLTRAGHQVTDAPNGRAGLQRYHEVSPDVVITDIEMAVMNGLELIDTLRGDCPPAKIVAITGGGPQLRDRAKQLGACHVLPKPFDPQAILDTMDALIGPRTTSGLTSTRAPQG